MMQAGRELDALVAEKVMGLTLDYEFEDITHAPNVKELRSKDDEWGILPDYSTDIAAAFKILDYLRTQGWVALLFYGWAMPDRSNGCTLDKMGNAEQISVFNKDFCIAICLAALKAVNERITND